MKPRRLRLSAFGPFADHVEVDFDRLAEIGLFVVSGPTGAGKTTLFDGLCYGLYGRLAGHRDQHGDVRSDHADDSTTTEVTVEFDAGGHTWRVWRHPRQPRPKKRGNGTTIAPADATLHRLDGEQWTAVEHRWEAVNQRCRSLIGLEAEQFQQVVLLPQGRFEQVLNARSGERQDLLRTLFQSELYRFGQDRLEAEARTLEDGIRSVDHERRAHLSASDQARRDVLALFIDQGLWAGSHPIPEGDLPTSDALASAIDRLVTGPQQQLEERRRRAEHDAARAADAATRAEQVANLVRRRDALRRRWSELEAQAGQHAERRSTLERAKRAAPVAELSEKAQETEAELSLVSADLDAAWARAVDACSAIGIDLPRSPDGDRAEQCHVEAEMQVKLMGDLVALLDEADVADRTARLRAGQREGILVEHAAVAKRRAEADRRLAAIESAQKPLLSVVAQEDGRRAVLDRARQGYEARSRLDRIDAELTVVRHRQGERARQAERLQSVRTQLLADIGAAVAAAERRAAALDLVERRRHRLQRRRLLSQTETGLTRAEHALVEARRVADDVFVRFVAGTAPRLAAGLVTGSPCPVCGSCEHPAPSPPADEAAPALDVVEAAAAAARHAEGERASVLTMLGALRDELGIDADKPEAELSAALHVAQWDVTQCEAAAARLEVLRLQLVDLDSRLVELEADLRALPTQLEQLIADRAELRGAIGDDADDPLATRAATVDAAMKALDEVDRCRRALAALTSEREDLEQAEHADSERSEQLAGNAARLAEQARGSAELAARRRREVADAVGDSTPQALAASAGEAVEALAAARRHLAAWVRADVADTHTSHALDLALSASGFADIDEALRCALDAETVSRLSRAVETWDRQHLEVRAGLAELSSHELPADAPDLAVLRQQAANAADHARRLVQLAGQAQASLSQARQGLARVMHLDADHDGMQGRARMVRTAAEVVRGRNRRNTTLEAWVLAAHLRDVVEQANEHLALMSGGRYRLAVGEGVTDGRAKAGLDLVVEDAYTGRSRPTVTLSGGETFQAALSLALGLADVITAGRAGLRLDALFIDEGFGSLDADALDQAVDVLDGLRSRGALVGVVTHVESLKGALPVALEVRPRADRRGSTVHQAS